MKQYVWVVEIQVGRKRKEWLPCAAAHLTRKDAQRALADDWEAHNPQDNFRVTKYVAEERK